MHKSLSIIINIYRIVNKYTFKILIFIAIMRINTLHTRIETRVLYNLLMQMQLRFYWSFETFCENNNILCNFWHCIPNKKDENETFSSLLSRITNEFNLPSDLKNLLLVYRIDISWSWRYSPGLVDRLAGFVSRVNCFHDLNLDEFCRTVKALDRRKEKKDLLSMECKRPCIHPVAILFPSSRTKLVDPGLILLPPPWIRRTFTIILRY